jgi:hypothetical protein
MCGHSWPLLPLSDELDTVTAAMTIPWSAALTTWSSLKATSCTAVTTSMAATSSGASTAPASADMTCHEGQV